MREIHRICNVWCIDINIWEKDSFPKRRFCLDTLYKLSRGSLIRVRSFMMLVSLRGGGGRGCPKDDTKDYSGWKNKWRKFVCLSVKRRSVHLWCQPLWEEGGGGAAQKMIQKIILDERTNEVNLSVCQSKEGPFIYDDSHFQRRGGGQGVFFF